ncbi:gamma carbonic anhydrase family protein [Corynebacterium atypicum]|uniref:gamma carbonic anhydrase family protein n=1 Tax=Corynebacterium atypicum TaxID=191610 RepID=UPI0009FE552C|nr:gamma carbonic anhydrase family protein [Corynebacterium atypicum]
MAAPNHTDRTDRKDADGSAGVLGQGPYFYEFNGKRPRVHPDAWIAPTATLIGDVVVEADASVFYGVVLRGDIGPIRVGRGSNIQDNSVLHVEEGQSCILGENVTVGHLALVHGAVVEDGCLIGMGSKVLSHAVIGAGSLVAAGAVVLENAQVPPRSLMAGVPAKARRELSEEQSQAFIPHAENYVEIAKNQGERVQPAPWEGSATEER